MADDQEQAEPPIASVPKRVDAGAVLQKLPELNPDARRATQVFELARGAVLDSLPSGNAAIVHQLRSTELDKLAEMRPEERHP